MERGDIVYGIHPIDEILKAKRRKIQQVYTSKPVPRAVVPLLAALPSWVPVLYVDRAQLAKLAGTTDHQGIVAVVAPFQFRKKMFVHSHHQFVVLVDGVKDTRNLGGIIRSIYCTGVQGLVLPMKQSAPINGSTCKAAAGLIERLEVMEVATALQGAQLLKKAGYHLYAGALGGVDATKIDYQAPLCLVIGSEETGVSPEVLALSESVMIPQKTGDVSYNASVAAGILLFNIARQKGFI